MNVFNMTRKRALAAAAGLIAVTTFALYLVYPVVSVPDLNHIRVVSQPDTTVKSQASVTDSIYRSLIHTADRLIREKKYTDAVPVLEKALLLKPADANLKTRIQQVKAMEVQQKKTDEEYSQLIRSADQYFNAKDWLNAKATYQLALNLRPGDPYAQGKMDETMGVLRSQKAQNILYDVAVANADKYFEAGDLDKARLEYEKASQILPSDQYARNRINEIIKIQVDQQVREELYAQAIMKGDQLYNQKKYQPALTEYKNALKQKPKEKYPQDRVAELTELLNQLRIVEESYQKALAAADQLYGAKRYPEARTGYQDALKIKPEEQYPKNRILEIDRILADQKRLAEEYENYIALADSFYIEKNFVRAAQHYQLALQIRPGEAYPKEMLSKTGMGVAAQEQSQKARDEAYAEAILQADRLFGEKAYEPARKEYNGASVLKPDEVYPKTRIAEIDRLLGDLTARAALDEKYLRQVASADSLLALKLYPAARTGYSSALSLKPGENYPKTKIAEIDALFAAEAAAKKSADDAYKAAIAAGDRLLAAKDYPAARNEYSGALGIRPDEKYPKDKIAQIDGQLEKLAMQKQADERYDSLISIADKLLASQSLDSARAVYASASTMKPVEPYPKKKIAEIDASLAAIAKQKSMEEQYIGLIGEGDRLFTEKIYPASKAKFQSALALKPGEIYPKEKITAIDSILTAMALLKAQDDQYASVVAKGDAAFGSKSWDAAAGFYTQAVSLKPDEAYPKSRLDEIGKIRESIAKQKETDERYAGMITAADKQFAAKLWNEARQGYTEAGQLKPEEKYPQGKIAEIDAILDGILRQKTLDEQYASAIASADQLLKDKSYEPARAKYAESSGLKPAESYPKTKMAEIDQILEGLAKQKALDDRFTAALADGDRLFTEKDWAGSKVKFQSALTMKPDEVYPKNRIAAIDSTLAEMGRIKALDEQYTSVVAKGDAAFGSKAWDAAAGFYTQALSLKPDEAYPKSRLDEIGKIRESIAKQKETDERYAGMIAAADKQFAAKLWNEARQGYAEAGQLKQEEKYPQGKIAEIDAILDGILRQKTLDEQYTSAIASADQLLKDKSYEPARSKYAESSGLKPAESYPKTKMAEIDQILEGLAKQKALDDRFTAALADGDRLFTEKDWAGSKVKFQSALTMKPDEVYPKNRIASIDSALAELARVKALDEQYASILVKGDAAFSSKAWDEAASFYTQAKSLKPSEIYPPKKLEEIEGIKKELARLKELDEQFAALVASADKLFNAKTWNDAKKDYQEASALKPSEAYPKGKIAAIDSILNAIAQQKALDDQYALLIANGDKLLAAKNYTESKAAYTEASGLKPSETYPKTRIGEIDQVLGQLKALEDQYAALIAKADQLMTGRSYNEAKTEYQKALKIKPAEKYPQERITEADASLAELARQKTIYDQYKAQAGKADQLFNAKQYEPARREYEAALAIKADESWPAERIKEIDQILSEFRARDEAYRTSVEKADALFTEKKYEDARAEYQNAGSIKSSEQYPKDRIGEINRILTELQGKKATYDNLLKTAGDLLSEKEYLKSKDLYQQASGIFPEEGLPRERIAWITKTVDSIYRANKGKYDIAVSNGDKYFNTFEFDKAIDAYAEAAAYLPMESYPRDQIARIRRTIADNAIVDVLKSAMTITGGDEKKFSFEPVNIAARKDNFVYLRIRNLSSKPFNILMRYGQDAQSNGGVVIRNITTDGKINERLISVRDQDLWYRSDNNWISLYPQGGDIEVSFIQVSKVR